MNILQHLARRIIKKTFHFTVWTIEQFHDISVYEQTARELKTLPEGTLGREMAKSLEENNFRLVPKFESHDLKHVLLDYKRTPVDEIRLQAFMLGNGNYTIASFTIFIFGAILLPDLWAIFCKDFIKGLRAQPIRTWTIEAYSHCQLSTLRERIFNDSSSQQNVFEMRSLVKLGGYSAIFAGILGMLFCLPFLFSSLMADLVGAGFAFLAAAILISGGLIALSNLKKPVTVE